MQPQFPKDALRTQAIEIWQAGVAAVRADRLVMQTVLAAGDHLRIGTDAWWPTPRSRLCVVGGGKAGAGMVLGLESALGDEWLRRTSGWVNVPADCVQPTRCIHLHAARPAGINEPTVAGQAGAEQILQLAGGLSPDDLCLVLISGGGSALLPAPCPGISLSDKQAVTRMLMQSGAPIQDLNCVRRNLSRMKGGGLSRACRAGRLISLIISDVIGDPLDVIASGPTVQARRDPREVLRLLDKYDPQRRGTPQGVIAFLENELTEVAAPERNPASTAVANLIIGNNQTAVAAAKTAAQKLGFDVIHEETGRAGVAREVGRELAEWALSQRNSGRKVCRISGGEPIVHLQPTAKTRRGGRNQELVLAASEVLWNSSAGIALLSGGTDGEDGPTDAAGAVVDNDLIQRSRQQQLIPAEYLAINNSYPFFANTGGLLMTGPTHTNVMDLRVVLVDGEQLNDSGGPDHD